MRTKNELYQEALRTVAARRQMARARAESSEFHCGNGGGTGSYYRECIK